MTKQTIFVTLAVALGVLPLAWGQAIEVSGDKVTYNADNTAVFSGNVVVNIGEVQIDAARLEAGASETAADKNLYKLFADEGVPIRVRCGDCMSVPLDMEINERVVYDAAAQLISMQGGVKVCADVDCKQGTMHAASGEFNQTTQILQLRGAPLIRAQWLPSDDDDAEGGGIDIEAQTLELNANTNELVLKKEASVRRGSNVIRGETIRYNTQSGALSAESGAPSERVQATFQSE